MKDSKISGVGGRGVGLKEISGLSDNSRVFLCGTWKNFGASLGRGGGRGGKSEGSGRRDRDSDKRATRENF